MEPLNRTIRQANALFGVLLLGLLTATAIPAHAQYYGAPNYEVPSYGLPDFFRQLFGGGERTYQELERDDGFAEAYAGCPDGTCRPGYGARRSALPRRAARTARLHVPAPVERRRIVRAQTPPRIVQVPAAKTGEWLPHAAEIQRAINAGHGRSAGGGMCARGVWRILYAAKLVKGSYRTSGADAKYMGRVLQKNGFVMDMKVCMRPGAVRIYDGNRSRRHGTGSAGDRVGHIEVVGTDHMFHHFLDSYRSMDQAMLAKKGTTLVRPLMQCWYKP